MPAHREPTAGFWVTVPLIAVLVAYPLSFGPACWLVAKNALDSEQVTIAYSPVISIFNLSEPVRNAVWWAAGLKVETQWALAEIIARHNFQKDAAR